MSNSNNNNNNKSSKKAGKPKKFGPLTEVAAMKREIRALKKQAAVASKNPQAVERRRQARQANSMARGTQIDLGRLNHDSRSILATRDPCLRMHHHLVAWVRQQSDPSAHSGIHPPYTDNSCQSVQVTAARTVRMDNVTIVAGQARQLSLFCRGPSNEGASVNDTYNSTYAAMTGLQDAVAYHTRPLVYRAAGGSSGTAAIFPTGCSVPKNIAGVVGTMALGGCLGVMSESGSGIGLGTGQACVDLTAAASSVRWSPMTPTTGLPYTSNSSLGHARAIMTGLQVRIINTTTQGSRAGTIVTVTPPHDYWFPAVSLQQAFAKFKTYKVHAVDDEVIISIPTRPIDMVYQHPNVNPIALGVGGAATDELWRESVFAATLKSAVAHIWLNNPSAIDQTYAYEITANWSLSGDLVAGISEEAPLSPGSKPLIVGASVKQSEAPHTTPSQVASTFAKAAADSTETAFKGLLGKIAAVGMKKVGEAIA